jgi:alkylation response protein AidB-like acyl-CoA dehydrogenase
MKFILAPEQRLFADTLDKLLSEADTPAVIRSWAAGDPGPGLALWRSLAETGVFALVVPEEYDGAGLLPVELMVAMEAMGRHAVPGPLVETLAAAVLLAADPEAGSWLPALSNGTVVATFCCSGLALDADIADVIPGVDSEGAYVGEVSGDVRSSLDPARRLFPVAPVRRLSADPGDALDLGVLACAAQSLGAARRLLWFTVDYAKVRHQFGKPIGQFQAIKHHLADVLVKLEFAAPLVYGAALSHGSPEFARDVSAAKIATAEAVYSAAKIALQVHGAIAYTAEFDPSLWIRKARALYSAWGTPAEHRSRIAAGL